MTLIGYVRCSTNRQMVLQQIDALRAAGCLHIYKDRAVRATAKKRPGLLAVRKALKPGDTFVITSIDRAFRSTIDAIIFLDDITKDGVTFRSLIQNIDTRTPEGRRWYIHAASDAEYERAVISRRTREQMAAAKRRGKKFGRPRKLSKAEIFLDAKTIPYEKRKNKASDRTGTSSLCANADTRTCTHLITMRLNA